MAKRRIRRKKGNKGLRLFITMLILFLIAGNAFYFLRNRDDNSNPDALTARSLNTESTHTANGTPTPVSTMGNDPNAGSVATATEELNTDNPQETAEILETPIVIQQIGASIHVINYTEQKRLAEEIRTKLEGYGFVVSSGNGSSLKYMSSAIVEKKEDVSGEELGNLLNIRQVRKEIDLGSRFDFIIILGDDFNP